VHGLDVRVWWSQGHLSHLPSGIAALQLFAFQNRLLKLKALLHTAAGGTAEGLVERPSVLPAAGALPGVVLRIIMNGDK
jgi:hypothetical protein